MEKHSVFTTFQKSGFILITLMLLLTGCQGASDGSSSGWFHHYFVDSFSFLIKGVAALLNDNYGASIVVVTLLIRLALMPLMLKQQKGSYQMREKMAVMKPELDEIKEKYNNKTDKESKTKQQQEMMQLYQKHGMNPLGAVGCLPMIIQFPILIGFYYAIRTTPEIASHTFLWFNLGHTDIVMPFIAAAIYFAQFKVTQIGMDPQQRKQMAIMGLLSPVMIGFVSFSAPAALPLYWTVGGLFLIFQTLLAKRLYQPKQSQKIVTTEQTVK
ncbi:membrane protein insertase YidC [Sediminibacillus dalangtanensis]|uniref:Membrane protein insertase YidC n=1 Tax=Sediminibacillus dalangtanensis TaxID=2729421 RepID=A0ABX7VVV2_9BACI|nr:membrane protein insertase YidC [Sediminibacillus dalangtanensis]QTM99735.1 membrane protein insertase YidC [Sediminibacillus dalangtanensis]